MIDLVDGIRPVDGQDSCDMTRPQIMGWSRTIGYGKVIAGGPAYVVLASL